MDSVLKELANETVYEVAVNSLSLLFSFQTY